MAKETLSHKVKTLEDQNKNQFKQIGKLEGQINTLMSLVTDVFEAILEVIQNPVHKIVSLMMMMMMK